jgi:Amt family ammonium transporter
MIVSWLIFGKADISMTLNGVLAGLVAVTAPCAFISPVSAAIVGVLGGTAVVLAVLFIDKIGIDDPVGAISVHGVCGALGTICVGLFAQASYAPAETTGDGLFFGGGTSLLINQLIGIGAVFAWCMVTGTILFGTLKYTVGLRVAPEEEVAGLDIGEHGSEAYPDFAPAIHVGGSSDVAISGVTPLPSVSYSPVQETARV